MKDLPGMLHAKKDVPRSSTHVQNHALQENAYQQADNPDQDLPDNDPNQMNQATRPNSQTTLNHFMFCCGYVHLISSQSLNTDGRRSITDDVATTPFHLCLFSTALRGSPNPISVHSLMLSSRFCLPLFLAPSTVPCRIVFAMPKDLEMCPYHHHALQLHSEFCCVPPRSSRGLCRK